MRVFESESYYDRVALQIKRRGRNFIAGDDDPYFQYKRRKFLERFLDTIDFVNRVVLEIGFGPGGNLNHLLRRGLCSRVLGVDISERMLELATANLGRYAGSVELYKINGEELPFGDGAVDVCFSVTVLQHNTDEQTLRRLVREMCRVTRSEIVIMEDIGESEKLTSPGSHVGRKVEVYESLFGDSGFRLHHLEFLNTRISRSWHRLIYGGLYKRWMNRDHQEGAPIGVLAEQLIRIPLFAARYLDDLVPDRAGLGKLVFRRP